MMKKSLSGFSCQLLSSIGALRIRKLESNIGSDDEINARKSRSNLGRSKAKN